jgi:hypothetical protein
VDREAKRKRCQVLLGTLRSDPACPPAVWELLGLLVERLDRLEVGGFDPEETPTKPERRDSTTAFARVGEILKGK